MKIIYRYQTLSIAILALTLLLTACERSELCYDHFPKASMTFAWEREWERDYGLSHPENWDADKYGYAYEELKPETPEWVNLVIYKNNTPAGEHFLSPDGGDVALEKNDGFSFLFYNGDTEYIVLSDIASLVDARASATSRSRSSISYIQERHPGTKSSNPPDILYSAYVDNIPEINVHEVKHIPAKLQPLVYTYVVRYEFEYGQEHISQARGALAGMAESVYLRDGTTSDESIIILYDCDVKDYGCEAHVRSFGVPGFPDAYYGRAIDEATEKPYTLNLEVLLTNGVTLEYNFDIAEQIKNQPRGGVITVSGLRIEDKDSGKPMTGGSFDVDLDGWGHEEVDLPLPDYQ